MTTGQHPTAKILVTDDDPQMRRAITRTLCDFTTAEAGDGAEAMRMLERERFDLVTLDLDMPHMPGREALKRIRVLYPALPVVIVSTILPADEIPGASATLDKAKLARLPDVVRAVLTAMEPGK